MDFDAPDMDTQREGVSRMDTARKGSRAWLILTLVAFPLLALVVALLNAGVSTVIQTKSAGQCDFTTKTFNARQEAFTLAQNVEQYASRDAKEKGSESSLWMCSIHLLSC